MRMSGQREEMLMTLEQCYCLTSHISLLCMPPQQPYALVVITSVGMALPEVATMSLGVATACAVLQTIELQWRRKRSGRSGHGRYTFLD